MKYAYFPYGLYTAQKDWIELIILGAEKYRRFSRVCFNPFSLIYLKFLGSSCRLFWKCQMKQSKITRLIKQMDFLVFALNKSKNAFSIRASQANKKQLNYSGVLLFLRDKINFNSLGFRVRNIENKTLLKKKRKKYTLLNHSNYIFSFNCSLQIFMFLSRL